MANYAFKLIYFIKLFIAYLFVTYLFIYLFI